jgi:ABC-type nitrate/sulfonate/bicarbonate transport systems, periplasmic components
MKKRYALASAALVAALLSPGATALAQSSQSRDSELFTIRVSHQPQRWALPWFIATEKGWWKELGLNPEISIFASGAPQIAAGASDSWDAGGAGNIPSVLGAARYGLTTIAIANSEEKIITLTATKEAADGYLKNPASLKGKTIPVPTNSTGHWGAVVCMEKKFGLKEGDYRLLNLSPPEINAAMSSGRYDVAQVWAPNTYLLDNTMGAKPICTGDEVGLNITSNVFVNPKFAKEHPEETAKFLAIYLRGVAWEHAHPEEAKVMLGKFFKSAGVNVPEAYWGTELASRPNYTLDEQLKRMSGGDDSWMGRSWKAVADFMVSVGVARRAPDFQDNATDKFLKMIAADPKLKAFVENVD